jgi:hypothetical protein
MCLPSGTCHPAAGATAVKMLLRTRHLQCPCFAGFELPCALPTADGGQHPTWNETLFFQISNETELLVTVRVVLQHCCVSS